MVVQQVEIVNYEFCERVKRSVERLGIPKNDYVESYLVSLLSKFVRKEEDFLSDQPWLFRLLNSKSLDDYVRLGDETLFITGFFPETFLENKRKKYVTRIGKKSYMQAAVKLDYEGKGYIFSVLSEKFERYSNVLHDIRYRMLERVDDQEFFELYKLWRHHKDPKALEKLEEATHRTKFLND